VELQQLRHPLTHIVAVLDHENRAAPWLSIHGWKVVHGRHHIPQFVPVAPVIVAGPL
jgi:hypothetical protein